MGCMQSKGDDDKEKLTGAVDTVAVELSMTGEGSQKGRDRASTRNGISSDDTNEAKGDADGFVMQSTPKSAEVRVALRLGQRCEPGGHHACTMRMSRRGKRSSRASTTTRCLPAAPSRRSNRSSTAFWASSARCRDAHKGRPPEAAGAHRGAASQAGDLVIKKGEDGDYFYMVNSGKYEVYLSDVRRRTAPGRPRQRSSAAAPYATAGHRRQAVQDVPDERVVRRACAAVQRAAGRHRQVRRERHAVGP